MQPRFKIGDRVVSLSGSVSTVIGNEITANGVTTTVEYTGRSCYPQSELEHADPQSVASVQGLTEDLEQERAKAKAIAAQRDAAQVAHAQTVRKAAAKKRR